MGNEHGCLFYLDEELLLGFIKFQARKELGKSKAGLYLINEALHQSGDISQDCYERHKSRYSQKLGASIQQELTPKLTMEQRQQNQRIEEKIRWFELVKADWYSDHKPALSGKSWREDVAEQAALLKDRLPKNSKGSNVAFEVLALWSQTYLVVKQDVKL
jgi:hypothetical protein